MKNGGTLDTNGLMKYLGIGRNNAQALMRRSDFPSVQISPRRRIVAITALERWLEERANPIVLPDMQGKVMDE